jgi:hypothetical protein
VAKTELTRFFWRAGLASDMFVTFLKIDGMNVGISFVKCVAAGGMLAQPAFQFFADLQQRSLDGGDVAEGI